MIYHGHCLDVLRTMPEASVHCVVTSPPYWSLRDYGVPPSIWGGDEACEHEYGEEGTLHKGGPHGNGVLLDGGRGVIAAQAATKDIATGRFCARCSAWLGCLGLEPTPDLFVEHLVLVFREVRRLLRDDGTLWLNMGDCYASGGNHRDEGFNQRWHGKHLVQKKQAQMARSRPERPVAVGLKPKDLVGVPWMLAFALRADGWYLRSRVVWAKGVSFCPTWAGSVMPESVTDRPTNSCEEIFLLTKKPRYFFDQEAVREDGSVPAGTRGAKGSNVRSALKDVNGRPPEYWDYNGKRNIRNVWAISPKPFPEAHFATFPEDLVIPCIAAGTSAHGVCPDCGAPYRRIVEMEPVPEHIKEQFEAARAATASDHGRGDGFTTRRPNYQRERTGERWEPTCECDAPHRVPATVLDPFAGSGTVGVVCAKMLRRFVGIELNQTYIETIAEPRIRAVAPLFAGD